MSSVLLPAHAHACARSQVPDPMARYKQLLFYASKLQPLAAELHTAENKVEGCVSQVWVYPTLTDGKVYFQADSDSQLTKGLAALLVEGLSGATCGPSLPPPSPPR
jgi:sulfur transfer protein SufE